MNTEGNAEALRAGCRLEPLATIEAQRARKVDIAPIIDMVGKNIQAQPQLPSAQQLIPANQLHMLKRVQVFGAWPQRQRRLQRLAHESSGITPVSVGV